MFDKWEEWHLSDIKKYTLEQITAYVFCVDAMNFCFWPFETNLEYEQMTRGLEKILDQTPQWFTPASLSQVTAADLKEVFDVPQFALMEERARLIRQIA